MYDFRVCVRDFSLFLNLGPNLLYLFILPLYKYVTMFHMFLKIISIHVHYFTYTISRFNSDSIAWSTTLQCSRPVTNEMNVNKFEVGEKLFVTRTLLIYGGSKVLNIVCKNVFMKLIVVDLSCIQKNLNVTTLIELTRSALRVPHLRNCSFYIHKINEVRVAFINNRTRRKPGLHFKTLLPQTTIQKKTD